LAVIKHRRIFADLRARLDVAERGWSEQLGDFAEHVERKP
jgi:hypothetical protein